MPGFNYIMKVRIIRECFSGVFYTTITKSVLNRIDNVQQTNTTLILLATMGLRKLFMIFFIFWGQSRVPVVQCGCHKFGVCAAVRWLVLDWQ